MQLLTLATNVSGTAVAAQASVNTNTTPFGTGRDVIVDVIPIGLTGTPTILVEGSDDNVTFVTLATHNVLYTKKYQVKSRRYMRANVTVAGSAGTVSVYAMNGV